jgi:sugar phosphate isomerase/epimerase
MDSLDDHFVACLDIGHAVLVREDPDKMIRALGGKYLKSLHVHDVDGVVDSHTLPFIGVTDWEAVMKALAEIDYQGEFTYEAGNFLLKTPDAIKQQALNYMGQVGKYLISRFDAYKAELAAK